MDNRIRLRVLGISYSQIQSGAYALVLAQINGPFRIPVVIGAPEAQSIALRMENVAIPRPLTHDLFVAFSHAFGVTLKEVFIYKFEDGIFSSELTFTDGEREVRIDSRTSDAVAIAMRTNSPIYTTPEILQETGFVMENEPENEPPVKEPAPAPRIENLAIEELEKMLAEYVEAENYEEAARISEIIKSKRDGDSSDNA